MTGPRQPTRPCPKCGVAVGPADNFCEDCGHDLLVSRSDWDGEVERRQHGRDRVEFMLGPVAGVSDRGRRGHTNEDAMALATVRRPGCWDVVETVVTVVCDGISSARRPEQASLAAAEAGIGALLAGLRSGSDAESATRDGAAAAAAAVVQLARPDDGNNPPSCTYVSAVVSGGGPSGTVADRVTIGWLGDSRAYWLAEASAPSACLTSDDSWAVRMVEAGALTAERAFADERAHTLVRWVGADAGDPEPRVRTFEPPGPGVVLVCSDGLWNYLPDAGELAAATLPLAETDPLAAAKELTQFALDAGGRDNITVVVVSVPPDHGSPA